jgi:hypothetical protein
MRWASALDRGPQPIGPQVGFVCILVVYYFTLLVDTFTVCVSGFTSRPHAHLSHYWLLLVLAVAYVVWRVLLLQRRIAPQGEPGFALAAYGLAARFYCHFWVFGSGNSYGSHSLVEDVADAGGRFLISAHRWGGVLAYVVGLALVVWGSRLSGSATRAWKIGARAKSERAA